MFKFFTNVVTVQGKGAWGVLQIYDLAICIGQSESGPHWRLEIFRPYSRKLFHFHKQHVKVNPTEGGKSEAV